MSKLTGNKDTDMLVLMQLEDNELKAVCTVNKYVHSLCEKQIFWLNRILMKLKNTCELAKKTIPYFNELDCIIITAEDINRLGEYFGFNNNYRELNNFLSRFTKGMQFSIFSHILYSENENYYEELLYRIYKIEKELLPKFINYQELIYYLRREIFKQSYLNPKGSEFFAQGLENIPGLTKIRNLKIKGKSDPDVAMFNV